eukprot:3562603-Rhodomonas_salina.5
MIANQKLGRKCAALEEELAEEKNAREDVHQQFDKLQEVHLKLCNEHEGLETHCRNIVEKGKHFQGQREEVLMEREKRMLEAEQRMSERERRLMEREQGLEERRAEQEAAFSAREARHAEMERALAALVSGEGEARRYAEELEEKRAETARLKAEAARLTQDVANLHTQLAANETRQKAREEKTVGGKSGKRKVSEESVDVDAEQRAKKRAREEYSRGWEAGKRAGQQQAAKTLATKVEEGAYWEECAVCLSQVTWPRAPLPRYRPARALSCHVQCLGLTWCLPSLSLRVCTLHSTRLPEKIKHDLTGQHSLRAHCAFFRFAFGHSCVLHPGCGFFFLSLHSGCANIFQTNNTGSDPACPAQDCHQCPKCRKAIKRRCTIFRGSGSS